MPRIRRNAFAVGKQGDPSPEQPQLEEVFGVSPSEDSAQLEHDDDDNLNQGSTLTQEQITGKIMKDVDNVVQKLLFEH